MAIYESQVCGAVQSPADARDYKCKVVGEIEYPESYKLDWQVPIKNQGVVGSCVAHALSEIIEYYTIVQEQKYEKMSTGYIYGNRQYSTYKGHGCVVRDALKAVAKNGDALNVLFPDNVEVPTAIERFEKRDTDMDEGAYCNRISQYYAVKTEEEIKGALMNGNPVLFSIEMPQFYYFGGDNSVLHPLGDSKSGCHCMVIYGWDKNGWKFQNSWGKTFGDNGRAVLPYDYPILEAWGVADNVVGEKSNIEVKAPDKWEVAMRTVCNFFISYATALKRLFEK